MFYVIDKCLYVIPWNNPAVYFADNAIHMYDTQPYRIFCKVGWTFRLASSVWTIARYFLVFFVILNFLINFAIAIYSGLRSVIDTFLLNQILSKFDNGIRKWQQCSRQCISQNLYMAWVTVAYPFHRQSEKPDSGISWFSPHAFFILIV